MSQGDEEEVSEHNPRDGVSVFNVTIGGQTYPVKQHSSCRVCMSPYRLEIERALIAGLSYKSVIKSLVDGRDHDGEPPNGSDLGDHVRGQHMPLPDVQKRALIERRAEQLGKSIEEGQESLIDYVGVNETIIERGFERLVKGEINPSTGELLNALKLQHSIDAQKDGSISDEMWMEAMMVYMEAAREVMPPEMWDAFGAKLSESPILQALSDKVRKQQAKNELEG